MGDKHTGGLLWSDDQRIDAPLEDVTARIPGAIAEAFGKPFRQDEGGVWRGRLRRAGKRFDVTVVATARGRETAIALSVQGRRSWLAALGVPMLALLTASMWIAVASVFVLKWRHSADPGVSLLLLVPTALTLLVFRLVRAARFDGMAMLDSVEAFSTALRRIDEAPRVAAGYRLGPRIADAADIESEAEALAADEEEANRPRKLTAHR